MTVVDGRRLTPKQAKVLAILRWRWQVYSYDPDGDGMLISRDYTTVEALARRGLLRLAGRRVWFP